MNFAFPDNKVIYKGIVKNVSQIDGRNNFSLIDIMNPVDNIISIDNTDYCFKYLNENNSRNKGRNSLILSLYDIQNIDTENVEYGSPDLILKILKFPKASKEEFQYPSEKRFSKEIEALRDCNSKNFQNIINIYHSGDCTIQKTFGQGQEKYMYYTMEYAKYDLRSYIETNFDSIKFEEKLDLCLSLAHGINELQSLGYYHRDIKPDNIFMTETGTWKIGDLGLVDDRNSDFQIDKKGEFIGPRGWISPEAMNKFLCEEHSFPFDHKCVINHQSDIFQLGKVFWYIFQHNAPIGCFRQSDFKIKNNYVYPVIRTMLNYSQERRYKEINEVIKLLRPLQNRLLKQVA
uniref:protein kinase domain-containing protein n=1 Tax=Fulvivirga sp. TaxID=1931237 RepID=UPI00404A90B1